MPKCEDYPKEIIVYVVDWQDDDPIFCVARDIGEIPEDNSGEIVGVYTLNKHQVLVVSRELEDTD